MQLTGKHFEERLEPATLVALSRRRAVMGTEGPLPPPYSNLLLRLKPGPGEDHAPEFHAKLVRPVEGTADQGYLHFTSVPLAVRARLDRLRGEHETLAVNPVLNGTPKP